MPNQLLLGSGDWHWSDFLCIDADPAKHPDIVARIPPLPEAVMGQRFSAILASHFIEHLHKWEALALLKQCYEILEPGGVLTLEQPDIGYCARVLIGAIDPPQGRDWEQFSLWGLYGAPNGNPFDGHKWGYTPFSLGRMVVEAGFSAENITISPGKYHEPVRDFTLTVTK